MAGQRSDPYVLTDTDVKEPPRGWLASFRFLGPGLILSASIVGSGELIATTCLGAQAGFVTLWVILVSCLVKVALQLEFGKHAITSGEPTMVALDALPGPRLRVSWSIWVWLAIYVVKFVQEGGVLGGVALALRIAFPGLKAGWWAWIVAISVSLLVFRGYYVFIQGAAVIMTALFTLVTIACVVFLQFTPYAFSLSDIGSGLSFRLPTAAVVVAIGAFGITGIGGDEIMHYVYWCIEKGYARFAGPRQNSGEWVRRAKGWTKVMYKDAILSMVVYTIVTAAFYILGAAVLHGRGEVPKGHATVETLSRMYTESLGGWAKGIFLTGAVVVLYSTLFAALAAWSRQFADAFGRLRLIDFFNARQRRLFIALFAWISPAIWCILFLTMGDPVFMVVLGGIATSLMLLPVVYTALYFRYRRLPTQLKPSRRYDLWLWLSVVAIVAVGVYGGYQQFVAKEVRSVKVAVCQIRCIDSDVEGNIRRITKAVEEAAAKGAKIAAFPETVFIGWVNTAAYELAEPIPGKFSDLVCHLAKKHKIMISIGLTEKVEEGIYDSMILVSSEGEILLKHRKINTLPELMTPPYLQGKKEDLAAVDTPLGRVGMMICADSFVDEHHRIMASLKPQLLLIPYGWAAERKEWPGHGRELEKTVSRIAKNVGAATVGPNLIGEITCGPWKGKTYEGHSVVADSTGKIIALARDNAEEVLIAEIRLPRGESAKR